MATLQTSGIAMGTPFRENANYGRPVQRRRAPEVRDAVTDRAGLTNLGSTCYLNAVIQALYLSDRFRSKLLAIKSLRYCSPKRGGLSESEWNQRKRIVMSLQALFG